MWDDMCGGVGRAGRKTYICLKRAWSRRDNNRVWAVGISLISVVCVVIKRSISETRVRGNMENNTYIDSLEL